MPEVITEMILPGTYIEVRAEGLITAGPVSVGNIGVVGTARKGENNKVVCLSNMAEAREKFGDYDPYQSPITANKPLSLTRAIELIYNNGGRTVYAVKSMDLTVGNISSGLMDLMKHDVHIVVAPGVNVDTIIGHCDAAVGEQKDRIGIVGGPKPTDGVPESDRLIYVTPGIKVYEAANKAKVQAAEDKIKAATEDEKKATTPEAKKKAADDKKAAEKEKAEAEKELRELAEKNQPVNLSPSYAACAVAGLISSLAVHNSPTNKVLKVTGLEEEYTYSELIPLIQKNVCVLSRKNGSFVVTKGITTDPGPFKQITTRRIVDKAKAGIRAGSQPYIGKLNNSRVRSALKSTLDGFLTTMVQDEALTEYSLEVAATRQDEIEGRCIVTATLKPTFSIDYIKIIMYLS